MKRELQVYNEQQKLAEWSEIVSQCRNSGLSVRQWCQENQINISNYYKWQRKIYALAKAQQEVQFAKVETAVTDTATVAVSIQVGTVAADIHNGADPATVENVLRLLNLC